MSWKFAAGASCNINLRKTSLLRMPLHIPTICCSQLYRFLLQALPFPKADSVQGRMPRVEPSRRLVTRTPRWDMWLRWRWFWYAQCSYYSFKKDGRWFWHLVYVAIAHRCKCEFGQCINMSLVFSFWFFTFFIVRTHTCDPVLCGALSLPMHQCSPQRWTESEFMVKRCHNEVLNGSLGKILAKYEGGTVSREGFTVDPFPLL